MKYGAKNGLVFKRLVNTRYIQNALHYKEDQMGSAHRTNGEKRNDYRILAGKPEGKRTLGRPIRRWVDNIKIDLRERG
jgi:hypothetical protein